MSQPRPPGISAAIRRAKLRERERCAKLADQAARAMADGDGEVYIANAIARAIRRLP